MSTFKSSNTILSRLQGELIQPIGQCTNPSLREPCCEVAVMRRQPESFTRRAGTFVRECWRKMKVMNTAFKQEELCDGARSHERSDERLRDELAWSRMDDDGGPNGHQPTGFAPTHPRNEEQGYIE